MFDVHKIRQDFPMLKGKTMQGKPLVYFDNAATSFKPSIVIEAITNYYQNESSSAHRGDYDLSYETSAHYEKARKGVADFIGAQQEEVVFTSGTTASLNQIAYGVANSILSPGDEVIVSYAEHASNILPWFEQAKVHHLVIRFAPLTPEGKIDIYALERMITNRTKIFSFAHVSNVFGYVNDIKQIAQLAQRKNILLVVDGAQGAPHLPVNVQDLQCDFYVFSSHKMCGPTGIGVLYGKRDLFNQMPPLLRGGGMNTRFDSTGNLGLQNTPFQFEAGTPHIAGAYGLLAAVQYLEALGMENIAYYERELRNYAVSRLKEEVPSIVIYNEFADTGIITFNLSGVFAQDAATHFNSNGIALRAGLHCAKLTPEHLHTPATVRASLYFYNTFEEVDRFVEVAKRGGDFLDAFFQ